MMNKYNGRSMRAHGKCRYEWRGCQQHGDTIRIRRPPRVFTNEHGRTIWMSEVKPVELEIEPDTVVSTNPYESARPVSL